MRIVVDRDIPQAVPAFSPFGDVELVAGRGLIRDQVHNADILCVRSVTRVDAALLDGTNVRFVGTATSGTDHLDIDYLRRRGIAYCDAAGCNARAVAEYVLACGFLHGVWSEHGSRSIQVGIIGYGHVGKMVHALLSALGVHCVVNDPPLAETAPHGNYVKLDEALDSDVVTLHVPLTEDGDHRTRDLIGAVELGRLRPTALLINAARGGVIDEAALREWITAHPQASVAIDCWVGEPIVDLPLLRLASVATPHIAGHTVEARLRATTMLAHHIAESRGAPKTWRAQHESPLNVRLAATTAAAALRDAVFGCCDPRVVSAMMRQSLGLPRPQRAAYFDELRRRAATRREFSAHKIACSGLQPDTVSGLRGLGFDTPADGKEDGRTE